MKAMMLLMSVLLALQLAMITSCDISGLLEYAEEPMSVRIGYLSEGNPDGYFSHDAQTVEYDPPSIVIGGRLYDASEGMIRTDAGYAVISVSPLGIRIAAEGTAPLFYSFS